MYIARSNPTPPVTAATPSQNAHGRLNVAAELATIAGWPAIGRDPRTNCPIALALWWNFQGYFPRERNPGHGRSFAAHPRNGVPDCSAEAERPASAPLDDLCLPLSARGVRVQLPALPAADLHAAPDLRGARV